MLLCITPARQYVLLSDAIVNFGIPAVKAAAQLRNHDGGHSQES